MAPMAPALHDVTRAALEGDGVGDRLFELLWKRDLFSDSALALRIPDTVIFRYSAPSVWYFTSVDGTIKRKTQAKVNSEHIFEEFLKKASPSGILACYVYSVHGNAEPEPPPDSSETDSAAATRTTIEYLNRDDLWNLLFNRQKVRPDGILQKFVEPKGDRNNMIRVLWSPKVCLLERRVNNKKLSDTKYDVYERAVTFEGSDFLSEVTPVRGPTMVMQVHDIADGIVQHIAAVTGDKMQISRMALNFKVDDRDRLWLLFASSLRLRDELKVAKQLGQDDCGLPNTPLEANAILQIPEHVRRIGTTMPSRPAVLQCTCGCPTCEQKVENGAMCDVSYKVIIEYEERKRGLTQPLPVAMWPPWPPGQAIRGSSDCNVTKEEVPQPLQLLHPRLTPEEYGRFRHDVAFLYKAASVCEVCYLRFSAPQLGSQWKSTLKGLGDGESEEMAECSPPPLFGTKALDPDRLRRRQQVTQRRVIEQKAAEDDQCEELLRCRTEKQQVSRAQSCPKLPSWGPGHNGPVVNPPAPVLDDCPKPPRGAAPLWADMRPGRQGPHLALAMSPQRRRKVPVLLGAPYLRDLQAFAINCPSRAQSVVPGYPQQQAAPGRRSLGKHRASAPVLPTAPAAAPQSPSPAKTRLRPSSGSDVGDLARGLPNRTVPISLDDCDADVFEDGDADPLVAKLWEKWPASRGSAGGRSTSAGTTRPPSAADGGTRLSSYPASSNSRNSSRPMSRLGSAQSRPSRPQSHRPQDHPSAARPLSSPVVRGGRSASIGERGLEEGAPLHRPSSSPQIRPRSGRPPTLARAASASKIREPS